MGLLCVCFTVSALWLYRMISESDIMLPVLLFPFTIALVFRVVGAFTSILQLFFCFHEECLWNVGGNCTESTDYFR